MEMLIYILQLLHHVEFSQEMSAKNCTISYCTGQVKAASKQQFESSWEGKGASRLAEVYPVSGEPGSTSCSTSYLLSHGEDLLQYPRSAGRKSLQ